jgi:ADP-ribose pyrophosphatase YjhB (NUDIX family)
MNLVTSEMRKTMFAGMNFLQIRDYLEAQGWNRHMPIELDSTEVALLTPKGEIILQVRSQNEGIGLWGGSIEYGETPIEGAIREVFEETGLRLEARELEYVERKKHFHCYPNGDQAIFTAYRYVVKMSNLPEIKLTDGESVGYIICKEIPKELLEEEREFVEKLLMKTVY